MAEVSGFIYGNFRPFVEKQIKTRQNVLSLEERSNENLLYITGKTAWIKMTSAVNITDESYVGKQYPNLLGDGLAKAYTLFGGTLWNDGKSDILRDKFGLNSNPNSAVNYGLGGSQEAGFRPMPGIINANIKSKNQFGSLREATINFKCWNLKQLEILEALYLRLGYQVLLEWGVTMYYVGDINGDNTTLKKGKDISYINFFETGLTQQKILQQIDLRKKDSQGNYDAILGVVKNFTFTATDDGGYDCVVNLVTWGEIVESLKINAISPNVSRDPSLSNDSLLLDKTQKSDLNLALSYLTLKANTESKASAVSLAHNYDKISSLLDTSNYSYYFLHPDDDIGKYLKLTEDEVKIINQIYSIDFTQDSGKSVPFKYIPLASLLNILRNLCLLKNQNDEPILNINISPENNSALSNAYQVSIDPTICLYPSINFSDNSPADPSRYSREQLYKDYGKNPFSPRIDTNDNLMNFLKIAVNLDFIQKTLDNNQDPNTGEVSLFKFLKEILSGINTAMGSMNQYDLLIDNNSNTLYIADAQLLPINLKSPSIVIVSQDANKIKSFVRSYSFSSRISNKMASTIAISAQANSKTINTNNALLSRLNKGLIDRITSEKRIFSEDETANIDNIKQKLLKIYVINGFIQQNLIPRSFSLKEVDNIKNILKETLSLIISLQDQVATFIPIDLTLVLDGISGIRIGECFLIEENKIPKSYKNINGDPIIKFLVREIHHQIESNNWTTHITGLSVAYNPQIQSQSNSSDQITSTQENPPINPDPTPTPELTPISGSAGVPPPDIQTPPTGSTQPNNTNPNPFSNPTASPDATSTSPNRPNQWVRFNGGGSSGGSGAGGGF